MRVERGVGLLEVALDADPYICNHELNFFPLFVPAKLDYRWHLPPCLPALKKEIPCSVVL